jgi:hypothetical protein
MGKFKHYLLATAGLVIFSGSAYAAAELFTPAFLTDDASQLQCIIANISDKGHTVTIQVRNEGVPVDELATVLVPGQVADLRGPGEPCADGCGFYCKFTVEGSKHDFRASVCFAGDVGFACVPAE